MTHNLHGDVPQEHLELAKELLEMEEYFDTHGKYFKSDFLAMGMVCLAHDYYMIGDDEKGGELLTKAEAICPGYFKNQINNHIKEDEDFALLIKSLTHNILAVAKSVIGE